MLIKVGPLALRLRHLILFGVTFLIGIFMIVGIATPFAKASQTIFGFTITLSYSWWQMCAEASGVGKNCQSLPFDPDPCSINGIIHAVRAFGIIGILIALIAIPVVGALDAMGKLPSIAAPAVCGAMFFVALLAWAIGLGGYNKDCNGTKLSDGTDMGPSIPLMIVASVFAIALAAATFVLGRMDAASADNNQADNAVPMVAAGGRSMNTSPQHQQQQHQKPKDGLDDIL